MPRFGLRAADAAKGGMRFQEGRVLIQEAYSCVFQYPRNKTTNVQSDAFTALILKGVRLDNDWEPLPVDEEAADDPNRVEIIIRMGPLDAVHPGNIAPKDVDNMDVEAEDAGDGVGTIGNAFFHVKSDARASREWGVLVESLEKRCGFKPEKIRGVTTDFEGMKCQFATEAGTPYIARKDGTAHKKGDTVTPTNLVVTRIHTYPYDVKKPAGKPATATASTAAAKPNGSGTIDGMELLKVMLGGGTHPMINQGKAVEGLSPEFRKAVPDGKEVKREVFQKAMVGEVTRRRLNPQAQKAVIDLLKNDELLVALQGEMIEAAAGQFIVDDLEKPTTVTFGA